VKDEKEISFGPAGREGRSEKGCESSQPAGPQGTGHSTAAKAFLTIVLLALAGCGTTGKAVRIEGTCECRGSGQVMIEAGDVRKIDGPR